MKAEENFHEIQANKEENTILQALQSILSPHYCGVGNTII